MCEVALPRGQLGEAAGRRPGIGEEAQVAGQPSTDTYLRVLLIAHLLCAHPVQRVFTRIILVLPVGLGGQCHTPQIREHRLERVGDFTKVKVTHTVHGPWGF